MRQRTPSALKGVANELAAVMGEIERIDQQLEVLRNRRQQLEVARTALDQVGATLGAPALRELVPNVRVHRT